MEEHFKCEKCDNNVPIDLRASAQICPRCNHRRGAPVVIPDRRSRADFIGYIRQVNPNLAPSIQELPDNAVIQNFVLPMNHVKAFIDERVKVMLNSISENHGPKTAEPLRQQLQSEFGKLLAAKNRDAKTVRQRMQLIEGILRDIEEWQEMTNGSRYMGAVLSGSMEGAKPEPDEPAILGSRVIHFTSSMEKIIVSRGLILHDASDKGKIYLVEEKKYRDIWGFGPSAVKKGLDLRHQEANCFVVFNYEFDQTQVFANTNITIGNSQEIRAGAIPDLHRREPVWYIYIDKKTGWKVLPAAQVEWGKGVNRGDGPNHIEVPKHIQ